MTDTDREARLEEIQERRQGITGTEWFRWTSTGDVSRVYRDGSDGMFLQHTHTYETDEGFTRATEEANQDLEFIAHAPEDIDWLLSEIDRLRDEVAEASDFVRNVGSFVDDAMAGRITADAAVGEIGSECDDAADRLKAKLEGEDDSG